MTTLIAMGAGMAFLAQLLGFIILVAILYKFAWKHIVNIFTSRAEQIRQKVEESEKGAEGTKGEIEKYTKQISGIDSESVQRMSAAEKEGRAGRDDILAQAKQSAKSITERAKREVTLEREKALLELRHDSIELTLAAADGLVDRTMDDKTHKAMVDEFIRNLDSATHK